MGLFGKAGTWLRGVFAGGAAAPSAAPDEAPRPSVTPPKPSPLASTTDDARRVSARPSPNVERLSAIPTSDPIREQWDRLKNFVARCDEEDLDLAGLRIEDPIGFWARHARIESAKLRGTTAEEAARAEKLSCLDHWVVVEKYFQARYSELVRLPSGQLAIRYVDAFQQAADRVEHSLAEERERIEAEARDLEPIQGVTLERFAEMSAALNNLGAAATRARTTEVLAAFGVGAATFGSLRRGWEARMDADKTRKLRRKYRAAWTHANEQIKLGNWEMPATEQEGKEISKVTTRYTWVESAEARAEYRSSQISQSDRLTG